MTLDNKTLLDELFQRYGHPSQEADFRINGYFRKAESLNKPADVRREDERADRMIEELSHKINQLKAYRFSLAERYSFLETAPTVPVVRLIREKDYYNKKVHYHLCIFRRFIDSDTEIEESRRTYPGTERNNAICDFHAYVKAHPGIIAEMDIERKHWER